MSTDRCFKCQVSQTLAHLGATLYFTYLYQDSLYSLRTRAPGLQPLNRVSLLCLVGGFGLATVSPWISTLQRKASEL